MPEQITSSGNASLIAKFHKQFPTAAATALIQRLTSF